MFSEKKKVLEFYFISFFLALDSELNRNKNDGKLCTIPLFFRALLIAIDQNVHLGVDSFSQPRNPYIITSNSLFDTAFSTQVRLSTTKNLGKYS